MELDVYTLSRLQFALTIMFHYLFPPLSIGLGWLMVIMEGMYLKTGDREYEAIARFWTGIFALVFAMGVATGIVMEFEFGTNWSNYSRYVGDVFGSALAAEGIFAFFLESGFLAVLVFGWNRVSPKMHFFSTCMVSLGAVFSSIWIVVANSWQQTPAGFIINEELNRAEIVSFWKMVFNPSAVHRLVHVWIGAGILGAFFVLSISSYYILKKRHEAMAKKMFKVALALGTGMSLAALVSGHLQARNVGATQPTKLAAFEALYETPPEGEGAPLYLFGFPNDEKRSVRYGLSVPGGLSFLMYESFTKPVTGLDKFPEEDWPPVNLTFQTYHLMVSLGMFFIAITLLASFYWWRGTIFEKRWLLWVFVFAVVGPFIANEVGWAAAEIGRQPWIVWGLLRTEEAFSPAVSAGQVSFSIVMFALLYSTLFLVWLFIMDKRIRKGPELYEPPEGAKTGVLDVAAELTGHEGTSLMNAGVEQERDNSQEG
jgi:cytochrome bd ubiquinol oxidase subunit I